ncbi:hypothetical protein DPMN_133136 [Dreissena polymorpha]|uniref:Uncharacterized protein n=1 Tax=Dreissena polymorpha TaxID=45954 RepID=A0A9D4JCN4_DREPO|nr:hypothetical protein DPMN_133136 [Dreissena polymorpha]
MVTTTPLTNCSLSRSQKPTLQGLSGGGLKDGKCDRNAGRLQTRSPLPQADVHHRVHAKRMLPR